MFAPPGSPARLPLIGWHVREERLGFARSFVKAARPCPGQPLVLLPGVLLAGTRPGSSAENLLNMSVSRARGKLMEIADPRYYRMRAPASVVTRLLGAMDRQGRVLTAVEQEQNAHG